MNTILVIDDEKDILEAYEYFLTKSGFKLIVYKSRKEALNYLENSFKLPNLQIIDWHIFGDIDCEGYLEIINDFNIRTIISSGYEEETIKQSMNNKDLLKDIKILPKYKVIDVISKNKGI